MAGLGTLIYHQFLHRLERTSTDLMLSGSCAGLPPADALAEALDEARARGVVREVLSEVSWDYSYLWKKSSARQDEADSSEYAASSLLRLAGPQAPQHADTQSPAAGSAAAAPAAMRHLMYAAAGKQLACSSRGVEPKQPAAPKSAGASQSGRHGNGRCVHN